MAEREGVGSLVSSDKDTNSLDQDPNLMILFNFISIKAVSPDIVTLRVGASTYEHMNLGGQEKSPRTTNIWSVTEL